VTTPAFAEYEAKREQLRAWALRHYVAEFDLRPGSMLDAGCGNGFWTGLFAEAGWKPTGVDRNPEYVAEAQRRHPDSRFLVADVDQVLPLGQFDVVFVRTLPHFFGPTLTRATKLVRNLLPHVGGLLLLSIYSDGSGEDRPLSDGSLARHHPDEKLLAAIRRGGATVERTARVGNYLQVGARA
jgi:SAM-dependent methyltransferase